MHKNVKCNHISSNYDPLSLRCILLHFDIPPLRAPRSKIEKTQLKSEVMLGSFCVELFLTADHIRDKLRSRPSWVPADFAYFRKIVLDSLIFMLNLAFELLKGFETVLEKGLDHNCEVYDLDPRFSKLWPYRYKKLTMFIKIAVTKNSEHIVEGQVARARRMTSSILVRRTTFKIDQDLQAVQSKSDRHTFL